MLQNWEAIRAEVLHRIQTRRWSPGDLIPNEDALATEFGCARATVNRALRDLATAGVLERKRKAGTRVAMLPVRKATLEISVIRQEVEARGQTHGFRLLADHMATPPVPVAARMGLPQGTQLRWIETLHLADNRPFVLEDRWLNPAILPDPSPDFAAISANEWLVANVSYASGDIAFAAEAATAREAQILGVDQGAPLFITERSTFGTDLPITFVRLAHAPGYRLQTLV